MHWNAETNFGLQSERIYFNDPIAGLVPIRYILSRLSDA